MKRTHAQTDFCLRKLFVTSLLWVAASQISACDTTERDWRNAQEDNTQEAYSEYLSKHPDSANTQEANSRLEALTWGVLEETPSIDGYRDYLNAYPSGAHAGQVRTMLEDAEWNSLVEQESIEGYTAFLDEFPDSERRTEAETGIANLQKKARLTLLWEAFAEFEPGEYCFGVDEAEGRRRYATLVEIELTDSGSITGNFGGVIGDGGNQFWFGEDFSGDWDGSRMLIVREFSEETLIPDTLGLTGGHIFTDVGREFLYAIQPCTP